jgi:CrcB protein
MIWLYVGIGGFLGAITRWGATQWMTRLAPTHFPLGTLFVNSLGCLIAGFLFFYMKDSQDSAQLKSFLVVGFLGSFTTFSAFGVDTLNLIQTQGLGSAALNVVANLLLSLMAVWMGSLLAQSIS